MVDHNSPEEAAKRASQEDPIVMYLIVRESLNMSIGKTAAQCAHASQMLQLKYEEFHESLNYERHVSKDSGANTESFLASELGQQALKFEAIFQEWLNTSFRKVVLRASEKEWVKLKSESGMNKWTVVDAGLTELESGTETVIGVWPMRKSEAPKIIRRLQVLK